MAETTVPEMTHPLSSAWDQPTRSDILIDDTHALMSQETFTRLHEYSSSMPSGVYEGKMWKAVFTNSQYLRWYGDSDKPDCCSNNQRLILIVD